MRFTTSVPVVLFLVALTFAMPCRAQGEPTRGYLGIGFRSAGSSASVDSITPGGPGDRAGVRVGDLVQAFNGAEFYFESDLALIKGLRWIEAGEAVSLAVDRHGNLLEVQVIPAPMTPQQQQSLDQWIARSEKRADQLAQSCAQEAFDRLVQHSEVTVTFTKSPLGSIELTSTTTLPANLDLSATDPLVSRILDELEAGDQLVIRYETENGILKQTVVEIPQNAMPAASAFLDAASKRQRARTSDPSSPEVPDKP